VFADIPFGDVANTHIIKIGLWRFSFGKEEEFSGKTSPAE
jgi:hypothetical protein